MESEGANYRERLIVPLLPRIHIPKHSQIDEFLKNVSSLNSWRINSPRGSLLWREHTQSPSGMVESVECVPVLNFNCPIWQDRHKTISQYRPFAL